MTPYAAGEPRSRRGPTSSIIGNVIRRVNPEATAVRERGIPQMSFPAALGSLVPAEQRHSVVVAGTHGKTTTTALLAHVLVRRGPRSVVPRRRRDAELRRELPARRRGRTSWSRATSTTPPTSTRGRSSCTTGRATRDPHQRRVRPRRHLSATWRTTRRRSRSSSRLLPAGRHVLACARRTRTPCGSRRTALACVVDALRRRDGDAPTYAAREARRSARRARASSCASARRASATCPAARWRGVTTSRTRSACIAAARALGSRRSTRSRAGFASFAGVRRRQEMRGRGGRRARASTTSRIIRRRCARRSPRSAALSRAAAVGGVRAALEHEPPQHPPAGVRAHAFDGAPTRVASSVPEPHDKVPESTSSSTSDGRRTSCARRGVDADATADVDVDRAIRSWPTRASGRRRAGDEQRRVRRLHRPAADGPSLSALGQEEAGRGAPGP